MRGYFGIGVYHPKSSVNIGTLWRSAYIFGASFMFTIGRRYTKQASDTMKSYRHIPLFNFDSFDEFKAKLPMDSRLVFVEIDSSASSLETFNHPQQATYVLGAEDSGLPLQLFKGFSVVTIPSLRQYCLNVSTAGSIIMYDRLLKSGVVTEGAVKCSTTK